MTTFAVEPIYGSMLLALLAVVATIAVILLVTPPTDNQTHRRWLIGLRLTAACVLLMAVFRPALSRTDNLPAEAALIVAVDKSRSMTLPDGDGNTRWETQKEVWRRLADAVAQLDQALSLRLVVYDAEAKPLADVSPDSLESETPDGELTDLSAAALAAIQAAEGQPIAGVVFMGDGAQTSPVTGTGAQRVVETLDSLGVPLWTVPIGPAGGTSASRDAAIDSLAESFQLFSGNQVTIDFQVLTRGLAGVDVPVRLSWIDASDAVTEIARRDVAANSSTEVAALSVPIVAPAPGTYRLKVEAEAQSGELVTTNNTQVAFVDVREGGGRILYLEGTQRLEQLFLRRSLRRFPDLDLTYRWIPSDTAGSWPLDRSEWFQRDKFDIYILGDLDADALGERQLEQLADVVANGAGLLTLGGYQTYGAGGYASSPLAKVIPVEMDPGRRRSVQAITSQQTDQLNGPISARLARNHPITDLGGQDPAVIWNELPPLLGANRFVQPRIAPGVMVLLQTQQQDSLLVVGQYGRGRTAALAFDSTWRWWRAGKNEAHRRFWRQLILWLLAREESSGDEIFIEMDSRRFAVSQPSPFRAAVRSLDESPQPIALVAEVIDDQEAVIPVPSTSENVSDGSSAIRGQLPKLAPGIYKLRVRPSSDSTSLEPTEKAFQVVDESRELANPMADPVYLQQLADLTADHGGAAYTADNVDDLIETINERRKRAETPVVNKLRLGDGPLSGWILFLLFAGAISTEWFLRRQWGLA